MSPREFADKMKQITEEEDVEEAHRHMDDLMCNLLNLLGYNEGVAIFNQTYKWYA